MASAWAKAWAKAWGNSWGAIAIAIPPASGGMGVPLRFIPFNPVRPRRPRKRRQTDILFMQ